MEIEKKIPMKKCLVKQGKGKEKKGLLDRLVEKSPYLIPRTLANEISANHKLIIYKREIKANQGRTTEMAYRSYLVKSLFCV